MRPFFLFLVMFLAFGSASAANDVTQHGPSAVATPSGYDVVYGGTSPAAGRSYANGSDGSVSVTDSLSVATAVGPLALSISRTVPWSAVVQGAVSGARACFGNPACIGTAAVVGGLVAYRCKLEAWSWTCDPGAPVSEITDKCWRGGSGCYATPEAAIETPYLFSGTFWAESAQCNSTGPNTAICRVYLVDRREVNPQPSYWSGYIFYVNTTTQKFMGCPSTPDGVEVLPGRDGRCPTGNFTDTSDSDLSSKIIDAHASVPGGYADEREAIQGAVPGVISGGGSYTSNGTLSIVPAWRAKTGTSSATTTTDAAGNVRTDTRTPGTTITNTTTGINVTNNTTTVTTVNGVTTETKTDTAAPETVVPPAVPAFGEIPVLYTAVYPNGIAGVWESRYAQIQQAPIFAFLNSLVPSFGAGGCPVWQFSPGSVLGIQVSGELSVPCFVWGAIRLIFVISALMVCRRLIFGG